MWMRPPWCTEGLSLHNLPLISLDRRCAEGFAISRSWFRTLSESSRRASNSVTWASNSVTFRRDVFIHRFLEVHFRHDVFSKFNSFDFHCHNFLCWHRSYWDTFLFDFTWTLDIQRSDSAHCNRYALAGTTCRNPYTVHESSRISFHFTTLYTTIDTTTTCCYHGCRDYRHRSSC